MGFNITDKDLEQIRKAGEAQERAEARYARMDLLERVRKERAERQQQNIDVYVDDPVVQFAFDMVFWEMEETAANEGLIESPASGLAAIQRVTTAYSALVHDPTLSKDFNVEVGSLLASIAAIALRTAIDLGIFDDLGIREESF